MSAETLQDGKTDLAWDWRPWPAFSSEEVYALLAARSAVFVVEQRCPYQELDGRDLGAWHLVTWAGKNKVRAALRVLPPIGEERAAIGRVLVMPPWRGRGIGLALMREGIARCRGEFGPLPIKVAAQAHLQRFYSELGFVPAGPTYDEDGILHIDMLLTA